MIQINFFTKQKETYRLREGDYGYRGKRGRAGIIRKFGMGMYTLLYLKWVINKDLLYSTGTLLSIMQQPKGGKNLKKNRYRYMYNGINLLYN